LGTQQASFEKEMKISETMPYVCNRRTYVLLLWPML